MRTRAKFGETRMARVHKSEANAVRK